MSRMLMNPREWIDPLLQEVQVVHSAPLDRQGAMGRRLVFAIPCIGLQK